MIINSQEDGLKDNLKEVYTMKDALYTEKEMYSKDVAHIMSQAGLIPEEEEISFEEYIRATSPGVMY